MNTIVSYSSSSSSYSSFDPCEEEDDFEVEALVEIDFDPCASSSSSESSESSVAPLVDSSSSSSIEQSNGSHHGHRTDSIGGLAGFLAKFFGLNDGTAPGGFGGTSDLPFSPEDAEFICSMKEALPDTYDNALLDWFSEHLAGLMGGADPDLVKEALQDPEFCETPDTAQEAGPIAFQVDNDGYPVSSNPVWNACVRGQGLSLALIRSNEDRVEDRHGKGRPLTCRDYHKGEVTQWQHPNHPGLTFTWDVKTKTLNVPEGYVVINEGFFASLFD